MPQNPPKGIPQTFPRLAYADPTRAVAWLGRAFGLRELEEARIAGPDGSIELTEMQLGTGRIMIGRAGTHGLESPAALGGRTQMVIAYVRDVDAHFERANRAGARIESDLEDQPWGDRRYEALDLEGHRWYFAERVRDVPREEWMREIGS